ncbi:MAG: hypothetical protein HC892_13730 [Saprospiraceae bacterium]|nr:hypothetical protein [Saprospiraceae bacterium]
MMQDCPDAQKGLRQLTYSYAIMTKVVEYNICQNALAYTKKSSKAKKAVTIGIGAALPIFRFENTFHKHNATQLGELVPTFGIGLDLGIIRTKGRASFQIETNYSQVNILHTFTPNLFDLADIYEQEVTLKGLRNTIALKYNLSQQKTMPYLFGGIGLTSNFEQKHILRRIEDDSSVPFVIDTQGLALPKSDLFALGGVGLISKNYFVELRYEIGSDLNSKTDQSLYNNRITLMAGYRLPFGKYK